jgi:F-type H+-transporting ATPase subunit a
MAEEHGHNPLDHVIDHDTLEIPVVEVPWALPSIGGVQITRFMVMEVVAALLLVAVLIPATRRIFAGRVTRGRFAHMFEAILVFIRDGIARPAIDGGNTNHNGHGHGQGDASHAHGETVGHGTEAVGAALAPDRRPSDRFLPFLWTIFFFVLFCNLLGMVPGGASPTGNIAVTGTLALLTFLVVVLAGMKTSGVFGFWKNLVPRMDVPGLLKPFLWGLMFVIEVAGLLIRHVVLAVRLFANMLAGHIVIAVILGFITMATGAVTFLVTPASLLGALAISLLELFVAFLQAYIFTFLAALFIGTAMHPH